MTKTYLTTKPIFKSAKIGIENLDEENNFDVERILAKKTEKNGQTRYLIKWLDYDETECTWVSEKNLNCPDVIKEFELENSQQLTQPKKKSPSRITITRKKRDENVYSDEEIVHWPNRRTKRSTLFCVFI